MYCYLKLAFKYSAVDDALHCIDSLIGCLVPLDSTHRREEKLKYLSALIKKYHKHKEAKNQSNSPKVSGLVERFLIEFKYHDLLLKEYKNLKLIKQSDTYKFFYDHGKHPLIKIDKVKSPVLGDISYNFLNSNYISVSQLQ